MTGVASSDITIYQAAQSWSDLSLSPELLKALAAMNFQRPSRVQAQALPFILRGMSIVAQAQHGSGKTGTYSLGMLSRVDPRVQEPQAICLCPTRELALQVTEVVEKLSQFNGVKVAPLVKGAADGTVTAQVVVGTPGTILAKIKRRDLNMRGIKICVLDEADTLVGAQGLGKESADIRAYCPKQVQTLLFSATFGERVTALVDKVVGKNAVRLELKKEQLTLDNVPQYVMECPDSDARYSWLGKIYDLLTIGQSIIFCNSIATAKQLTNFMNKNNFEVSITYGQGMTPEERDKNLAAFKEGKTTVLVTTNLLARGLDVPTLKLVVNFDLPVQMNNPNKADHETYIHRIHRAGRFGRKGVAINFTYNSGSKAVMNDIEEYFAHKNERLPLDEDKIEEKVKAWLKDK